MHDVPIGAPVSVSARVVLLYLWLISVSPAGLYTFSVLAGPWW